MANMELNERALKDHEAGKSIMDCKEKAKFEAP